MKRKAGEAYISRSIMKMSARQKERKTEAAKCQRSTMQEKRNKNIIYVRQKERKIEEAHCQRSAMQEERGPTEAEGKSIAT